VALPIPDERIPSFCLRMYDIKANCVCLAAAQGDDVAHPSRIRHRARLESPHLPPAGSLQIVRPERQA
jgi:hypothetical protein